MDRQVVASGRKLNFRGELRWVAKRTRKFPRKYKQVAKIHFKADYPLLHWLIIGWQTSLSLRWLGLGGQTVKNLLWLACKFDLDQSERKSSQVNASVRKAGQTKSQVDPRPKSTCYSVWPRLELWRSLKHGGRLNVGEGWGVIMQMILPGW